MSIHCNSGFRQYLQSSIPSHFLSQQLSSNEESDKSDSMPSSPTKHFKSSFTIDSILGQQHDVDRDDIDVVSIENKKETRQSGKTQQSVNGHLWTSASSPITPSYNMMVLPGFGLPPSHLPIIGTQPQRLLYRNQMCTCGDTNKYQHMAVPLDPSYSGGIALVDPSIRHPLSFHECYFAGKFHFAVIIK